MHENFYQTMDTSGCLLYWCVILDSLGHMDIVSICVMVSYFCCEEYAFEYACKLSVFKLLGASQLMC